jgi:hypothetical protein
VGGLISAPFSLGGAAVEAYAKDIERRAWEDYPSNLPSPADLVRFELRETFKQPYRDEQLKPPASDAFKAYMKQLGYNEFWADSYWAAHWTLPSTGQGFEMYQRLRQGAVPDDLVFSREDLKDLIKRNDVLPLYHDQLIEIAYVPFTRVDVRRMYKLGTLDYNGVLEAYKDLGYKPEKAKLLADFTASDIDDDDLTLLRPVLLDAYSNDEIDRVTIIKLLRSTFRKQELFDLWLALIDQRKVRKSQKQTATVEKATTRVPTIAKVETWFKLGVIDVNEAVALLAENKVDDIDIKRYVSEWIAELNK